MKLNYAILAVCLAASAFGQEAAKFYRLDFAIKELDETKVVSTKKYSTFISTDDRTKGASIRVGTKVPYSTGSSSGGTSPVTNTQYNYADVGVNIDCQKISEANGHLVVQISAEITSIPASEGPITTQPIIRQNRWFSVSVIEPAKPTTLFSSDDLNSKRKLQLELTATPVR